MNSDQQAKTTLQTECVCGYRFSDPNAAQSTPRSPCPVCGSSARKLSLQIADKIGLSDETKGIGYAESRSKWFVKFHEKRELYRKTGRWHRIRRAFNKRTDQYDEVIRDDLTGELVRECSEPLSEHRGRGTARKRSAP